MKDWDKFQIPEKELANKWDEHSPRDVADRLTSFTTPKKEYPKTCEEFVSLVREMREAQRVYSEMFPTGHGCYAPIELEKKVDEYLKKMEV